MRAFDIHFHAFNFTHVHFPAFLQRHFGTIQKIGDAVRNPLLLALAPLGSIYYRDTINQTLADVDNFINLGFILSQDLETYLDRIEEELTQFLPARQITRGNQAIQHFTLVPLIMDFTDPGFNHLSGLKYGYSGKSVVKQTVDLLRAIKSRAARQNSAIDYLPFLGLNPFNYALREEVSFFTRLRLSFKALPPALAEKLFYDQDSTMLIWTGGIIDNATLKSLVSHSRIDEPALKEDHLLPEKQVRELIFQRLQEIAENQAQNRSPKLLDLLNKYFGDYHPGEEEAFYRNQQHFTDIEQVGSNVFGGIKLYPPLGFDPWPDYAAVPAAKNVALQKVKLFYQYCQQKNIPLTVHCSSGGFQVMPRHLHLRFTSPERWRPVLQNYPRLKINFAHCGVQDGDMTSQHQWKIIIFHEFMLHHQYPNVYSDVSDLLSNKEDYQKFMDGMQALHLNPEQRKTVGQRLLFGTDFAVSLRGGNSYGEYLNLFAQDHSVFTTSWHKQKLMCENPQRFLFQ